MGLRIHFFHGAVLLVAAVLYGLYAADSDGTGRSALLHQNLYPVIQRWVAVGTDAKFRWRGVRPPRQRVAVLEVDTASLSRFGRWPWPRDVLAHVVDQAFDVGAQIVVPDMLFSEPQMPVPEELADDLRRRRLGSLVDAYDYDRALGQVVAKHRDRVVLAWHSEGPCRPSVDPLCDVKRSLTLPQEPGMERFALTGVERPTNFNVHSTPLVTALTVEAPVEPLRSFAQHAGFVNAFRDADGLIRRSSLVMMYHGKPYPHVALEAVRRFLGDQLDIQLGVDGGIERLRLLRSNRDLPVSRSGAVNLNFNGPATTFPTVSVLQLLEAVEGEGDPALLEPLRGAVVFLGVTALGAFDVVATPLDRHMPGVEVNATLVDNLLTGLALNNATRGGWFWFCLIALVIVGVVFSIVTARWSGPWALGASGGVLGAWVLWDGVWLFQRNVDLPSTLLLTPWFAVLGSGFLWKYLREQRSRAFLKSAFSKYLSPQVVESLIADPSRLSLGGARRELTTLFTDLRGFTSFSEQASPEMLCRFLNEYLSLLTQVVFHYEGTVDKYIGDALMAFWGAPVDSPDHCRRACEAATEMVRRLRAARPHFKAQYGIEPRIGVGVNSALVTVGNMGSELAFNYTAVGDGVNLASRLEKATKMFGAEILTTQPTLDRALSQGAKLCARSLGAILVKGKEERIELVQLLPDPVEDRLLQAFQEGRKALLAGELSRARALFMEAGGEKDPVCEAFLRRIEELRNRREGRAWDGLWSMAA